MGVVPTSSSIQGLWACGNCTTTIPGRTGPVIDRVRTGRRKGKTAVCPSCRELNDQTYEPNFKTGSLVSGTKTIPIGTIVKSTCWLASQPDPACIR